MRLIRFGLISFIFLFLLITGISLFIPSHVIMSKAINIKSGKDSVMAQISNAANWKNWQPGMDTSKLLYIAGEVKGVILDDKDPQHPVCIKIDKIEPDQVTAQFITKKMKPVVIGWKAISYPNNDSVTVQWYMDFHLRWYPWEKFGSLVLEKSHGARMEQGLTNLKKLLQSSR